jgi:hypothetical protein
MSGTIKSRKAAPTAVSDRALLQATFSMFVWTWQTATAARIEEQAQRVRVSEALAGIEWCC